MIRRRQIPFTAKTEGGENPTPVLQTPASPTWTGLYVGAFAGYKYSAVDHGLTLGGTFNQIPFVKGPLESRGSGELNNGGAELGGLLGFNYQMRHVVFGLEAARRLSLGAKVEQNTGPFVLGQEVPPLEVRTSLKTRYLVTLAPWFGIALHFLPYVTGGMAIGDLDFSQSIHDLADPASRIIGEKTQTNVGWMVGGGVQYAISQHWSARMQYQYIDLGHTDFNARVLNSPDFRSHHHASLAEHNANFALIYRF